MGCKWFKYTTASTSLDTPMRFWKPLTLYILVPCGWIVFLISNKFYSPWQDFFPELEKNWQIFMWSDHYIFIWIGFQTQHPSRRRWLCLQHLRIWSRKYRKELSVSWRTISLTSISNNSQLKPVLVNQNRRVYAH